MKKRIGSLWLSLLILALSVSPALAAETPYALDPVFGRLTLDNEWFQKVLTPDTLEINEEWLTAQGRTLEDTQARYEEEGILLEAFDPENSRVLVVTAVQDVNAEEIYDVNLVDEETRRNYRLNHSKDVYYGIQGYRYESATWKNYGGNLGRFLQLKYSLSRNGSLLMRGYQRRTVRNGRSRVRRRCGRGQGSQAYAPTCRKSGGRADGDAGSRRSPFLRLCGCSLVKERKTPWTAPQRSVRSIWSKSRSSSCHARPDEKTRIPREPPWLLQRLRGRRRPKAKSRNTSVLPHR